MNLLLQPYARPRDKNDDNYLLTLAKNYDLRGTVQKSNSYEKPDLTNFLEAHPDGKAKIWALGNSANSKSVFSKLDIGDLVLFHGKNLIYGY